LAQNFIISAIFVNIIIDVSIVIVYMCMHP